MQNLDQTSLLSLPFGWANEVRLIRKFAETLRTHISSSQLKGSDLSFMNIGKHALKVKIANLSKSGEKGNKVFFIIIVANVRFGICGDM